MNSTTRHIAAMTVGFALDAALGDPPAWPHPVRLMGKQIEFEEGLVRKALPDASPAQEKALGAALVFDVVTLPVAIVAGVLYAANRIHPALAFAAESVICYQMIAARSLRDESMKVHDALENGTLDDAHKAVSMIVGRDTECLDEAGVARAAVETVAENASDGVIAPLLYMGIGGAPAAVAYKAVNTLDSMVGYKNDRYMNFGWAAAHVDDIANFVPARISGALMCAAAALSGFDAKRAWNVFKRDRLNHTSPNSAHTEAACAGALGVQLGGGNYYFGSYVEKPTIGDDTRPVETEDIARANKLMYATAALGIGVASVLGFAAGAVSALAHKR